MNLVQTALSYLHKGLSPIPTHADKSPACQWRFFMDRRMTESEAERLFSNAEGIGIVTGKVSGDLELLDFDDHGSRFEKWFAQVPKDLQPKLVVERSPSGGKHVYYRIAEGGVGKNRKLAMNAEGKVLIETRGEGGYVKCAPSGGYVLEQGDFMHIPVVTPIDAQYMIEVAQLMDETPKKVQARQSPAVRESPAAIRSPASADTSAAITPWDDYAARGDIASLLESHGWHRTRSGGNEHWERPGKSQGSTSATWNGEVFYVFSSNAAPFEPDKGYGKFQIYALLECGGDAKEAARRLRREGYGSSLGPIRIPATRSAAVPLSVGEAAGAASPEPDPAPAGSSDPGPLPEELLHVPGFVDTLAEHTLSCAPYPNRVLAFAGAISMLAHLSGRNFRDSRDMRTNLYLLALADSGVGKDFPRKINMRLASELELMGGMADRFASAEGLEDALLVHPCSFFQVDEVDTLFASLQENKDSTMEKIYGALLQFATSSDTTYAMRKKAIQQPGGKASKFDKLRSNGIREPHLVLLGTAIPKYLYSALSERSMENGLLSRCLVLEAGERGEEGSPHREPFPEEILGMGRYFRSLGGFQGLDMETLEAVDDGRLGILTVKESEDATACRKENVAEFNKLYKASKTTSEKALWSRAAEKAAKLALLYAISENPTNPLIGGKAVEWSAKIVSHLTRRMLFQSSMYVHDSAFDALRRKAIRYLKEAGGHLRHGLLLKRMHVDADTFRKVMETLAESEIIAARPGRNNGTTYFLLNEPE